MKNLEKIKREKLKTIQGGKIPLGCNSWNQKSMCCRSWDSDHCSSPTCPDSPAPAC